LSDCACPGHDLVGGQEGHEVKEKKKKKKEERRAGKKETSCSAVQNG
jgi:hypothetical protein